MKQLYEFLNTFSTFNLIDLPDIQTLKVEKEIQINKLKKLLEIINLKKIVKKWKTKQSMSTKRRDRIKKWKSLLSRTRSRPSSR